MIFEYVRGSTDKWLENTLKIVTDDAVDADRIMGYLIAVKVDLIRNSDLYEKPECIEKYLDMFMDRFKENEQ